MLGEKRESEGEGGRGGKGREGGSSRKQLSHAEKLSLSAGAQSTGSSVSWFDVVSAPGKALEENDDTHPALRLFTQLNGCSTFLFSCVKFSSFRGGGI